MTEFDLNGNVLRQRPQPRKRAGKAVEHNAPIIPPAIPSPPPIPVPPALPQPTRQTRRNPAPLAFVSALFALASLASLLVAFVLLSWAIPRMDVAGLFHAKPKSMKVVKPASVDIMAKSSSPLENLPEQATDIEPKPAPEVSTPEEPHIISTWEHFVAGARRGEVRLYSNGRLNDPYSDATWTQNGDELTFTWPNPAAPGGAWIDRCTVSPDGQRYSGTNQHRSRIEGNLTPK